MLTAFDSAVFDNPSLFSLPYVYYRLREIANDADCLDMDCFKPLCITLNWVTQVFPGVASTPMKRDEIEAWRPKYCVPEDDVQLRDLDGYETAILEALEAPEKMWDDVRAESILMNALFIVLFGKGCHLKYHGSNRTFSPGSGVRDDAFLI